MTSESTEKDTVPKWMNTDRDVDGNTPRIPTCNRKLKQSWLTWAVNIANSVKRFLDDLNTLDSRSWTVTVLHIERVKSYAPKIDHLVADVRCNVSHT